jgi:lipoprotein-anchoring transpeptidase ErfK/SrfK
MRARALLFGGLLASLFVPIQGAEALIANVTIDPMTRQPLVVQPQPSAPNDGQTGSSVGQSYRYQPGGRGYGVQAAYGNQSYAPAYGRTAPAYTPIPRQVVDYPTRQAPGSIVINTGERRLYYVLGGGKALRYGIGVGRLGFQWSGVHHVSAKREWPDWHPPGQMLRRQPYLPRWMPGGPNNPLGARAMYIGSTLYRIHGSNEPWTIGHAVSSGCIRMTNEDVVDLYSRVRIGARVTVMR